MWVLHGSATSMPFALFEEMIARNIIDQGLFKALYTTFVGYWTKLLLGSVMSFQVNLEDSFSHLTLVRVPFTGRVPVQMVDLNISDIQWKTTSLLWKKQGSTQRRIEASSTPETTDETTRLTATNHNGRSSSGLLIVLSSI